MSSTVGPDISENGLVLYLDAGNPRSYPRSGTTWVDLSGNDNGSFVGGSIFPPRIVVSLYLMLTVMYNYHRILKLQQILQSERGSTHKT